MHRLLIMCACLVLANGCAGKGEFVYISVRLLPENFDPLKGIPSDMGKLRIYLNGNFWSYVVNNTAGPINKFLVDGWNSLEVTGNSYGLVEVNLVSAATYGKRPSRSIFEKVVRSQDGRVNINRDFRIKRPIGLSFTLDTIDSLNPSEIENELVPIIRQIYTYCIAGNMCKFVEVTLAGYHLHSPHAYSDVRKAIENIFIHFDLSPFPEDIHFVYGKSLVTVYSRKDANGALTLFDSKRKSLPNVAALTFARIGGDWVVW